MCYIQYIAQNEWEIAKWLPLLNICDYASGSMTDFGMIPGDQCFVHLDFSFYLS